VPGPHLIDTDVLIEYLRGEVKALQYLEDLQGAADRAMPRSVGGCGRRVFGIYWGLVGAGRGVAADERSAATEFEGPSRRSLLGRSLPRQYAGKA